MKTLLGRVTVTGAAAIAACAFTTTMAHADDATDVYIGGSIGGYALDVDDIDFDDGARFVRAYAGLNLSENLSIEGDYTRLSESEDDIGGTPSEFEADAFSVFVRPSVSLSDHIDIYGKAGWSWYDTEFRTTAGVPATLTSDDDDFAWGGGVDLHLSDNLTLRGDFTRIEVDDADLDMLSAGLTFRF